ncbi:putative RNA polymerase II subunit B1 CTD phosphatase RPAP2 [Echinops telfairi]|uniref:RNA polymerase II subunit B1 CTD phosphatase RPAP2 n=1 Tax=Echinops telfairi TaxID=9371 RepID=A0AC55D8A8_ECHTE|nr:putative RNA polymerase II subunit B1 CTD phosphatase RPAP2 [Echinops telfairi]
MRSPSRIGGPRLSRSSNRQSNQCSGANPFGISSEAGIPVPQGSPRPGPRSRSAGPRGAPARSTWCGLVGPQRRALGATRPAATRPPGPPRCAVRRVGAACPQSLLRFPGPRTPPWPRPAHAGGGGASGSDAGAGPASDDGTPMADSLAQPLPGRKAGTPAAARKTTGIKQTSASKQEDVKRRAELEAAVRKKIEFERRALHLVEQLLEENITEDFLIECGKVITSDHYNDVVDERSISKLCGYPLCQKKLGIVPKQKYKISTKTNKVYDITERKCFCSNFCYKASKMFQAQIPKTPVWIRGEEERHPGFQLLKEGQSGHSGEEVQLCTQAIKTSDIDDPGCSEKQYESSSPSTCSDSSSDDEQDFVSSILPGNKPSATGVQPQLHRKGSMKKKADRQVPSQQKDQGKATVDVAAQLGSCRLGNQEKAVLAAAAVCVLPSQNVNTQISSDCPLQEKVKAEKSENRYRSSEITLVGISKKSAEYFKNKFAKSNHVSRSGQVCPEVAKTNLLKVLKETFMEWKTEETLRFLHGQNYASVCLRAPSALLTQAEELDEDDFSSDPARHAPALRNSAISLDEALPFRGSDTATKPLPSYENLKKETETLNVRIREFYRGQYVLNEESTKSQDSEERDPTFPLIDSSSQNQIRKRIVLEKLSKILPGLLRPLQIALGDIYTQLKNLVRTFRLTNRNIIHKPTEWTLIAVVLLSLLVPRLGIQKHSEENVVFTQFIATLLEELHLKNEDLESLTTIFRTNC